MLSLQQILVYTLLLLSLSAIMFQDIPPFYEMRNPFLVLRLALFGMPSWRLHSWCKAHVSPGILVYVNVLTIGFAAWNLTVLKDLEVSGE